jgi:hypothetical protein
MGAAHFELSAELEALLQQVCSEEAVPARRQDELRLLLTSEPSTWPQCCGGSCTPCVEDSKAIAREVLMRWRLAHEDPRR